MYSNSTYNRLSYDTCWELILAFRIVDKFEIDMFLDDYVAEIYESS
jgi:hypothetical protein